MTVIRICDLSDAGDRARADAFVHMHPDASPFHRPAWSVAVEQGCRQRSLFLVAERGGAIAGVLPLTAVRSRLFGNALVSAGFAVRGGVLAEDASAGDALVDAACALGERERCGSIELRGGPVPTGWHIDAGTYVNFARPLAADDTAEMLAIPRRQRAEVRKALANDLTVEVARDAAALAIHHAVYGEMVHNLGTPVFPASLFRAVVSAFGDDADILTVRHRGTALSSVLNIYFRGTVYPFWGGGIGAARALRANDRMYFALMGHARARGCTGMDFGRSKVGTGPALWKKTWGFAPDPLVYAKRAIGGGVFREINPENPKYQRRVDAWKRLPLWTAKLVGPYIARELG
jgi:FemAB-related protein (PEP-CTERM system-associated)